MNAATAPLRELWRGDFETGDLSQWERSQQVAQDRIAVVAEPVAQGRWAARFEVQQGDNPLLPVFGRRASGDRAELVRPPLESEGQERWYEWSTYFPEDFPRVTPGPDDPYAFQIFAQWHQEARTGSPPLYFQALNDELTLATHQLGSNGVYHGGPVHWRTPLERGRWHAFKLHVRWSANPARGLIALWHDGKLALPAKPVANLVPGQRNYFKAGLYRSARITATSVVYQDGFRVLTR